ncbi:MAG: hypothetical protein ABMA64_39810 [Myxococcota bacterium]
MTKAMAEAGECGYCHTALPRAAPVVHVTKVEVHAPDVNVGGLFDSLTARLAGCFTGCLSMGVSVGITGMILLFVGWQLWVQSRAFTPSPSPSPHPVSAPRPAPAPANRGRRR